MPIKRRLLSVAVMVAVAVFIGGCLHTPASAQSTSANAAQGIEISPALVELNAAKGNTYVVKLTVTNVTSSDLAYSTSVNDFTAKDETGSPQIVLDSQLPETASIKTWLGTVEGFTLKSRQSRTINVQVTIPEQAEAGGHYGVLRFSGRAPELENTGVGLSASAGVLMLIRVDGAITEKASLVSFLSVKDDTQRSFFETSPIGFVTRIKNEGNVHIKPVGSIEVRDMFGGLVATIPVNDNKANVLPESIRRFEATYSSSWMIGRYTADLAVGYGTTGQAITSTISFWVIPYKILLAALLLLGTIIFVMSRLLKVYNKRIIAKSKNENTTKNKSHRKK